MMKVKKMKAKNIAFGTGFFLSTILLSACTTVDLEKTTRAQEAKDQSLKEQEREEKEMNMHEYLVEQELKTQDIEPIVVFVEKPVYVPDEKPSSTDIKRLSGIDAANDSLKIATRKPENYKNGTFFYTFSEDLVYEIYCQPYHLTDIILEPGELVQGSVLISEDEEVWELTANVAKDYNTGNNIQHLFLKPAYSKLDSSMVVITDRRVYHFRIKSFSDTHMAMVKFKYPMAKSVWATRANDNDSKSEPGVSIESEYVTVSNPEFLSFDYKIRYGLRKPEFLPEKVYDDGQKTYIVIDDVVLHKKLPVLFNEKNEIANYSVHKNVFIVPRLINKATLRLGWQKVTIEKKRSKVSKSNVEGSSL